MQSNITLKDEKLVSGSFIQLKLDDVSYYPTKRIQRQIALNIYGIDLEREGLPDSKKYQEDEKKGIRYVDWHRPLGHCDVEGDLLVFMPKDEPAWAMMDIRKVLHERSDVNLSIISSAALMPHKLTIEGGTINEVSLSHIYVIDRDGSKWSLHCR